MDSRKRPARGVFIDVNHPIVVFLTVCTKDRVPWLAEEEVHARLCSVWCESRAWLVGRYVLMPDHLHLFAAPGDEPVGLERWVKYWKSQLSMNRASPTNSWQAGHWDTRLRTGESYESKWEYVRNNPVRAGLVANVEAWPFQGELNVLTW